MRGRVKDRHGPWALDVKAARREDHWPDQDVVLGPEGGNERTFLWVLLISSQRLTTRRLLLPTGKALS